MEHVSLKTLSGKARTLVAGGAGFLGSHLCERLLAQGHAVTCLDNFSTGSRDNVRHLVSSPDFQIISHDVTIPLTIEADFIFNLACPASPVQYQRDPIRTLKTSVLGALNLLDVATRSGARILQASTSEIYGDPTVHPQPESYWGHVNTIGPRACYDEGKRCAETLFFDYQRVHNLDIRVVRIFNTYGPRMQPTDGRVVSNFIIQALRGENLTIYGDGRQTRSFCYVDDLIDGMCLVMNTPSLEAVPVNLGNPGEFTIIELARQILALTKSTSEIIFTDLPKDDPKQRRPDITRIVEATGWQPTINLAAGLEKTIAYFRSLHEGTRPC